MNWDYLRGLVFEYWYYLAFGIMLLFVVALSLYYIQTQFERRRDRLETLHLYPITKPVEEAPEVAPLDPVMGGVLFPRAKVYLPLRDRLDPVENWGNPVRYWTLRQEELPVQSAPELRGPP